MMKLDTKEIIQGIIIAVLGGLIVAYCIYEELILQGILITVIVLFVFTAAVSEKIRIKIKFPFTKLASSLLLFRLYKKFSPDDGVLSNYPLSLLVGTWHLQYGLPHQRGEETAKIDKDANYYFKGNLVFLLKNFEYDKGKKMLSYDKVKPDGTKYHREVLHIESSNLLLGHREGKHNHLLRYERQSKS